MPGKAQPLFSNQPIVNPDGTPTLAFMRWAQVRQADIVAGTDTDDVDSAITTAFQARSVKTGTGLDGGGDLSADRTIILKNTAVTPGTYGNATEAVILTVDPQGRITHIDHATIQTLPDAPSDGKFYCRQNGAWVAVNVMPL